MNQSLVLRQNATGYRYNRDSFLLAHFFSPPPGEARLLDVGAGVGVLGLLVKKRYPHLKLTLLELQPELVAQANRNIIDSGADCTLVEGDFCDDSLLAAERFDAIVCNPPYYKRGSGRQNPDRVKAIARHEIRMTLTDLISRSSRLLAEGGSLSLGMIMERRDEFLATTTEWGFYETRLCVVRSFSRTLPRLFLSELRKGERNGSVEESFLTLKNDDGSDSALFLALQSALLGAR